MTQYLEKAYDRSLERAKAELPKRDLEIVLKFERSLQGQEISSARRRSYLECLIRLHRIFGKSFEAVRKDDIETVLAELSKRHTDWTIHDYKVTIKRFWKWFKGMDKDYPAEVKWIKTTPRNRRKMPRDSLLSKEEIEKLLYTCDNPRNRAIVSVLAESGVRASELLDLKIGYVRFDRYGVLLTVRGKTGDRTVRLVASAPDLARWLENHPFREDPNAWIWINLGTKKHAKQMTIKGLGGMLQKLKLKAGVKKRVHPHGFRHSAATRLAKDLTEAELSQYMGWVQGSRMTAIYVNLASRDVDKAMLRIHGLINQEEAENERLTVVLCPRCRTKNGPGHRFCANCGLALDLKVAIALQEVSEGIDKYLTKVLEDEEVKTLILSKLKEIAASKKGNKI